MTVASICSMKSATVRIIGTMRFMKIALVWSVAPVGASGGIINGGAIALGRLVWHLEARTAARVAGNWVHNTPSISSMRGEGPAARRSLQEFEYAIGSASTSRVHGREAWAASCRGLPPLIGFFSGRSPLICQRLLFAKGRKWSDRQTD